METSGGDVMQIDEGDRAEFGKQLRIIGEDEMGTVGDPVESEWF